jgi:hypothetical protein
MPVDLNTPRTAPKPRLVLSLAVALLVASLASSNDALAQGPEIPVVERAQRADLIVVGEVEAVQSNWRVNEYGDRLIVSAVRLGSVETLKGQPPSTVTVEVEGGSIDGVTLKVSDLPAFTPGERAVFFLSRAPGRRLVPNLRGQGVMKLDQNDRVEGTGLSLAEIRQSVAAAGR